VVDAAHDEAAGLVYASHGLQRRIHVLRSHDLHPMAMIGDATFVGPRGLAVDSELRRVYVARTHRASRQSVDALTVIQRHATGRHTVDRTMSLGDGVEPRFVAVDVAGGLVFVAGRGGACTAPVLIVLDRLTLDELGRTLLPGRPTALTVEDGAAVLVQIGTTAYTVDGRAVAHSLPLTPPASLGLAGS
jgi:hypothetical protein